MKMDRRSVLGLGGMAAAGVMLAPGWQLIAAPANDKASEGNGSQEVEPTKRWGMLIDVTKCAAGCTNCTSACRQENNVPMVGNPERDIHWIRQVELFDKERRKAPITVPMLCNHCEHPPCVDVCPTKASFIRKDGIVLVDMHRCIGCRYCMIACPYKARSLVYEPTSFPEGGNPKVPIRAKGVVEKCTFCVHRIDEGQQPACVEACQKGGNGGMMFGDLNDPNSEIAKTIRSVKTQTIRPDLGLKPQVYYQGL